MSAMRKVVAILVGLAVFEAGFFLLGIGLRPLRHGALPDVAWWALRLGGILVALLAAMFAGSALWPRRKPPPDVVAGDG